MRHQRTEPQNQPQLYREKLLGAVSRMLNAADNAEREKIIADNPILLSDDALRLLDEVIRDFDENITIVKDFPRDWKRLRKFLGARQLK